MFDGKLRSFIAPGLVLALVTMAGCGSTSSDFAGTWSGTKTYLTAEGTPGGASEWTVEIRESGSGRLVLPDGVGATVTSASTFEVDFYTYPPAYPPGPEGHCVPVVSTITSGAGALDDQGALRITLRWSNACGGTTGTMTTVYDLHRGAGAGSGGGL